jgi:hypothetical protein
MLNLGPDSMQAVSILNDQGIALWPEQDIRIQMPKDISSLHTDQLSELFSNLTAWVNYTAGQLAAAQVDERSLEKRRDLLEAKLFVHKDMHKTKGDSVTLIKAQILNDPKIVELEEQLLQVYAYRKMLEVVYNNFERDIALVSREITRRSADSRSFRKDKYIV